MNTFNLTLLFFLASAYIGCFVFLLQYLKKKRRLIALIGLFFLAMSALLLTLDLVLIALIHGPRYIPDYLLFNRLVSDSGFAGRWVLTVYIFLSIGLAICIYLLARNMISKFNMKKQANNLKT